MKLWACSSTFCAVATSDVPLAYVSLVSAEPSTAKMASTARAFARSGMRGTFWPSSPPSVTWRICWPADSNE